MRDDSARTIRLADYRPPDYLIDDIDLSFDLDPEATRVRARSRVTRRVGSPAPLVLDGVRLVLERIAIDGADLPAGAYRVDAETLTIFAPPAGPFSLEIDTRIAPAANTALEGLYVSGGRFCTQCEAEGFRKITYALDRPDNLARYTVRLEADAATYPILLSNGNLIDAGPVADGRHYAVWHDPHPKPTYLFAAVAGAFDVLRDTFTTRSGRVVQLGIHVDLGDADRARYAMDSLKRAMEWDEIAFAREYDLDVFNIVAVRDFNFGAMENKGLNVFNSAYVLADPATATDLDYEAIESIVGHEYFHNWTGNRITLRDWFQLCVKEGLTVYRDQEFSADQRSRPVQRIKDVRRLRARQFPEDSGPLAHPVRPSFYQKIDNFYTATVYEKGAELIRMLRALIGDEAFARGMQLYFERCDGKAVTVEDFLAPFAETSGQDLTHFMSWYAQAGAPRVKARATYDAEAQTCTISLEQTFAAASGPASAPLPIPLRIGFVAPSGAILATRRAGEASAREEHLVRLDGARAEATFEGVVDRPIPAYLRGFTAPVILDDGLSDEDRLVQMAHDPDAFTRWEAGQSLARAAILARAGGRTPLDAPLGPFADALAREVARASQDWAFAALALRLPDLPELIQHSDAPDPDRLYAAREAVRARLADALYDPLHALASAPAADAFSPDAASAGRRALKTAALDLLAAAGPRAHGLLASAYEGAGTMTEQLGALEAIGAAPTHPGFDAALEAFFAQWRLDPLVVDKWFSAQAAAARDDALARASALRRHSAFDLKNPNRVRALVGAFSVRNPRAFHAADGSGYHFLADVAAEIDPLNPALAARLLGAFETWRRFDEGRRAHAQRVLSALAARPGLSRNAGEIVARTLA